MLKIVKRAYPLEEEGRMNRIIADATDMAARDNVSKGNYFILHDVCYQALRAIPKGAEVIPGTNCVKRDLNEMIGGN